MAEKAILFSAPMIRAILDGRKTQTRRILKTPRGCPRDYLYTPGALVDPAMAWWQDPEFDRVGWSSTLPYSPGDLLWVRETLTARPMANFLTGEPINAIVAAYAADDEDVVESAGFNLVPWWHGGEDKRRSLPAIHMPRRVSRITLDVAAVRVERLQDITEDDAQAEGCGWRDTGHSGDNDLLVGDPVPAYSRLWDRINGPGAWTANRWVVAVSFKRIDP